MLVYIPPACCYATIYYAIKEVYLMNHYSDNLLFYKRYIDDVFAIWIDNNTSLKFEDLEKDMNFHRLRWEVQPLSTSVVFLDMTISITNNKIHTIIYEKELNLYLYISPHSAHPPGVLAGLIIGNILRIHHLCSDQNDKLEYYNKFYKRLRNRGYLPKQLNSLFNKGLLLARTKPMPTTDRKNESRIQPSVFQDRDTKKSMILHIPYHPRNPTTTQIQ